MPRPECLATTFGNCGQRGDVVAPSVEHRGPLCIRPRGVLAARPEQADRRAVMIQDEGRLRVLAHQPDGVRQLMRVAPQLEAQAALGDGGEAFDVLRVAPQAGPVGEIADARVRVMARLRSDAADERRRGQLRVEHDTDVGPAGVRAHDDRAQVRQTVAPERQAGEPLGLPH